MPRMNFRILGSSVDGRKTKSRELESGITLSASCEVLPDKFRAEQEFAVVDLPNTRRLQGSKAAVHILAV